ncbi:MAG: SGNH/GDSL hydrolase family protein [Oscillospiraceae bacterium]|nr:SGNH/GDSL hydrolase family protein [Oscillospiraceae bacterium]
MSNDIGKIDKNLLVPEVIDADDCVFYDVRQAPFEIFGLYNPTTEPVFKRLPDDIAEGTSKGVQRLAFDTSGGRVRFSTDSEYIAINAAMSSASHFPHMPMTGSSGFDLYVSKNGHDVYAGTFPPPATMTKGYTSIFHFGHREMREITINFPLYNVVDKLSVGVSEDAKVTKHSPYTFEKPIVFYGSSITQGGCASRPGNAYPAFISQKLDCDFINLGFSGVARAEETIMNYIASLPMSVFVYDYDHNAPTLEHLVETHERGYKIVREKNPSLPIIFVSAPRGDAYSKRENHDITFKKRRAVVFETYSKAFNAGDENVYFVDGASLYDGEFPLSCTVDGTHPNDLGFLRMATSIGKVCERVISK